LSGIGPEDNARSRNYLLEGTLPGVLHPSDIASDNKNPTQSGCETGGLTYYYAPMAGAANYQAWQKVLVPIASIHGAKKKAEVSSDFNWSGSVDAPPGDSIAVTEQDVETLSLEGP
jgi:hypothetical protein